MSLNLKSKTTQISLLLTHNKRITLIFRILEFVSLITTILAVTFIIMVVLKPDYIIYQKVLPIFIIASFLGFLPGICIKNKERAYFLLFLYTAIFFLLFTFRIGNTYTNLNTFTTLYKNFLVNFFLNTIVLNYILLSLLIGEIVIIIIIFLVWGLIFNTYLKMFIILISYTFVSLIFFYYFYHNILSYFSYLYFTIFTIIIGSLIGYFENKNEKSKNFVPILFGIINLTFLAGIPIQKISSALLTGSPNNVFMVSLDLLGVLSFLIINWLGIEASESTIFFVREKNYYSALINIMLGLGAAILLIYLGGTGLIDLGYSYKFITNFNNFIFIIISYFIMFFIAILLSFLILGKSKFKSNSLILGFSFIVFYAIISYSGISFYISTPLLIGSLIIVESTIISKMSIKVLNKYFKGKSILDKSTGSIATSTQVDETRPPLCWVKSGALEGYIINGVIGVKSGFGYVLDAYDPSSKRRVAIKVLKEASDEGLPIAFDAETLNKFNEEHAKLKNLKGIKNIVNIVDTHLPEIERYSGSNRLEAYIKSPPYIVMEFLTGGSLSDAYDIFTKKEYIRSLLLIIYGVSNGLYEAHSKGIIHGDIKPDNILFASIGKYTFKSESVDPERLEKALLRGYIIPKLTDFGTAKVMSAGKTTFSTATLHFAPPEILVNQNVIDQRYDIYELGLVLYYELAGVANSAERSLSFNRRQGELSKLINEGKFFDRIDDLLKILAPLDIADVRNVNPGVSEKLWLFIKRAIDPNPLARPKTMNEFSKAIKTIAIMDYNFKEIDNYL
jgi:serine/threonine protein kinase